MYKISEDTVLTPDLIKAYIDRHKATQARLNKLNDYYGCKHDILQRQTGSGKPNNKLVNPYANYITDMFCGYFMGEPVAYNSEDTEFIDALQGIFNLNDEQAHNAELAKDASIFGVAYELLYLDEAANVCFAPLDSREVIPLYSDSLNSEILFAIRYYKVENILRNTFVTKVEVYSPSDITYYTLDNGALSMTGTVEHSFGMCPVVEYRNNDEQIGDFEPVVSLIDAYDKLESDSINDFDYFADAYLALVGMSGTTQEDIAAMRESRVLLLEENGKADWLIKDTPDAHLENMKNRIAQDIHTFSKCPKLTDENFAGNATGVAMKYKLMGLENATAKKERAFKKGLQRRIRLIAQILNILGGSYDWRSIDITFTRNLPVNVQEAAELAASLQGIVSEETLLAQLPFVTDVQAELQRKKAETTVEPYSIAPQEAQDDE
jgi:SPP1 family phage portal protein